MLKSYECSSENSEKNITLTKWKYNDNIFLQTIWLFLKHLDVVNRTSTLCLEYVNKCFVSNWSFQQTCNFTSVITYSLLMGNDEVFLRQIFIIILGLSQKIKITSKKHFSSECVQPTQNQFFGPYWIAICQLYLVLRIWRQVNYVLE